MNIDLMELFVILLMVFVQELGEQRRTVLHLVICRREDDLAAKNTHKANTEVYDPDDVIVDLLDLAAQTLVLGGRISYLFPTLGT